MKPIFWGIICAVFIIPCIAQKQERNLYAETLSACVNKEAEDYGKLALSQDYNNRIVEYDEQLTDGLPTQFGAIKVEYIPTHILAKKYLAKRYKKNRESIEILSIRPMQSDGTKLTLNVLSYSFSAFKENAYYYALGGGCRVDFIYDPEQKQFILAKTELWGI